MNNKKLTPEEIEEFTMRDENGDPIDTFDFFCEWLKEPRSSREYFDFNSKTGFVEPSKNLGQSVTITLSKENYAP